jgi:hypothetical protein
MDLEFGRELTLLGPVADIPTRTLPLLNVAVGAPPPTRTVAVLQTESAVPLRPLVRRAVQAVDTTGSRFVLGFLA